MMYHTMRTRACTQARRQDVTQLHHSMTFKQLNLPIAIKYSYLNQIRIDDVMTA